jgi:hypothetical protein
MSTPNRNHTPNSRAVLLEPFVGHSVRISGLKSAKGSELNGKVGVAQHYQNHRIAVQIEGRPSLVSVSIGNLTLLEETLPHVLTTITVGGMTPLGRTLICADLLSIFMERCLVEQEANNVSSKRNLLHCAACGTKPDAMVTCAGCGLCQWCDNNDCQRRFVEAGHGHLCRQYRALREIFDDQVIQQAALLFQSAATQLSAYSMAIQEAAWIAKTAKLSKEQAEMIKKACHSAVQWPASAKIATSRPGTKVQLSGPEIDQLMIPAASIGAKVPGKLTLCATSHKAKLNALSKKELKEMHTLPCGKNCGTGLGITTDATHAPIQATLRDLSIRHNQQSLCSKGCNDHNSPAGIGKAVLSNVYYSFCLDRVCNASDMPGSILHCPMCGLCRNYMYAHTSCCNKCSYGSKLRIMPCMHCHDIVPGHDGVIFVPRSNKQCPPSPLEGMAAMFGCTCGSGRVVWRDPTPSTRRPFLHKGGSDRQQATSTRESVGFTDESVIKHAIEAFVESAWRKAPKCPLERVELIDKASKSNEARASSIIRAPPEAALFSVWASDQMMEDHCKATDAFMKRFKAQYDVADTSIPFEAWLDSEREQAAIAAKLEYQELRRAGKSVNKMRHQETLAKRCHSCSAKATEYKDLKACSSYHSGFYCGAACQRKDWVNHRKSHRW